MNFDFGIVVMHWPVFLNGLITTFFLSVITIFLGTVLGILLALAKRSKTKYFSTPASAWIDFFRIMPILVLLVWFFYALPLITGFGLDAFWIASIVLTLAGSAFIAETFKSGFDAIPQGEIEAAYCLGLNRIQVFFQIILPQAFLIVLAPLIGNYIEQIKNTTLATIIAANELLHLSQILISQTYRPLEIYTTLGILFFVLLFPLTYFSKKIEQKFSKYRQSTDLAEGIHV
ncbi:MAG: amino acid ABC transporter permease [Candidatus Diapherotrites archaeon]|nr:amino acid ABC transporter permease [Candidatus Diapherotrites archaeon]